jgi:hypothetical protein
VLHRIGLCLAVATLLSGPALAQQHAGAAAESADAIAAAMKCLDDFMTAWNAHDFKALAATFNYPHVRLNGANGLETISRDHLEETFEKIQKTAPSLKDWHHSAWEKREVVAAAPNKVHIQTRFVRYRADDSVLSSFDSLYIVTKEDSHWGIRIRSSFAP